MFNVYCISWIQIQCNILCIYVFNARYCKQNKLHCIMHNLPSYYVSFFFCYCICTAGSKWIKWKVLMGFYPLRMERFFCCCVKHVKDNVHLNYRHIIKYIFVCRKKTQSQSILLYLSLDLQILLYVSFHHVQ